LENDRINNLYNFDNDLFSCINLSFNDGNITVSTYSFDDYKNSGLKNQILLSKCKDLIKKIPSCLGVEKEMVEKSILFGIENSADKDKYHMKIDKIIKIYKQIINKIDIDKNNFIASISKDEEGDQKVIHLETLKNLLLGVSRSAE
jgi:hypothetical protein